jgi:hypothetical protein
MEKPPSPESEMTCLPGERRLGANSLRHGIGHRAVPERTDQPAFAVHREIARRPHRRQADIAGEDGILCRQVADRLGDLLRMDQALAGRSLGEIVEPLA